MYAADHEVLKVGLKRFFGLSVFLKNFATHSSHLVHLQEFVGFRFQSNSDELIHFADSYYFVPTLLIDISLIFFWIPVKILNNLRPREFKTQKLKPFVLRLAWSVQPMVWCLLMNALTRSNR